MTQENMFTELEILAFDRIAMAHSLIADEYSYAVHNQGYGIYGKTPANGGILEIGFVEQNPVVLTGESGEFLIEENGIFILPPQCNFRVSTKEPGLHRHTCAEFLIRCRVKPAPAFCGPVRKKVILPLYLPPSPDNSEILSLIRSIATAKTARLERSYFEECADFMLLIHKLCERIRAADQLDAVSPGNRRHCARAKAYISQNIDRKLTVGHVASAIGVSKNYLTNVFSGSEGVTLTEYINRSKLSYMMALIRRYDYTLAQAGKHVGLTDVNYISRIFKRYYGMTVTEYKRSIAAEEK